MRAVKQHGAPTYGSDRTNAEGWSGIGAASARDRLYWKLASDLLFVMRPSSEGRFVYEDINPAFESLVGIASEDIRGMAVCDCMGRQDARSVHEALDACRARGAEVRIRHRLALRGSRRTVETIVAPICDPVTGCIATFIGSHRVLEGASSQDFGTISDGGASMGATLVSIQEDMQQRIASDLHDSTCQHLIAASLGIMRMRNSLSEPTNAERLCDDIDASIDQAIKEIRAFAYLLHPQNLTVAGLKAAIERYAEGFAARTSLRVDASISPEIDRVPYETQRSLLRVVQEALTNVFRHAKATEVEIAIEATDDHFRLRVSDNGRGMPLGQALGGAIAGPPGVGIPAMKVRLQQIGGTLDIRSGPGTGRPGTTLSAVFPRGAVTGKTQPAKGRSRHHGPRKRVH
ncbi:ATP-binding protein [Bradyrhizobium sp. Arg237L]|uniref:sensor histidine kinase n=1 Tax=Bradyrhizobium sp. Arg237L TaxID=3003352 RepID=UPI00249F10BC|nr:ATP-binding protein [Bradyrhizobium sp. Arg237L]MDI4235114.1 ATP-binding protein [Bradyrhizobium sp. Arg237L]